MKELFISSGDFFDESFFLRGAPGVFFKKDVAVGAASELGDDGVVFSIFFEEGFSGFVNGVFEVLNKMEPIKDDKGLWSVLADRGGKGFVLVDGSDLDFM